MHEREADPLILAEMGDVPSIDVHGYDAAGAVYEVSVFCSRMRAHREQAVKIIHGRGKGILRDVLLRWAKQEGLRAVDSSVPYESGGVLYIQLCP